MLPTPDPTGQNPALTWGDPVDCAGLDRYTVPPRHLGLIGALRVLAAMSARAYLATGAPMLTVERWVMHDADDPMLCTCIVITPLDVPETPDEYALVRTLEVSVTHLTLELPGLGAQSVTSLPPGFVIAFDDLS